MRGGGWLGDGVVGVAGSIGGMGRGFGGILPERIKLASCRRLLVHQTE